MKILIVSEGEHEGSGALEALLRRTIAAEFESDFDAVKRSDIHAHHGKGRGYFKKAVRWMLEARKRGYDALVLLIDEDGVRQRRREIVDAQEAELGVPRRALGVAVPCFDAWILADEHALTNVLGSIVDRQTDPESLRSAEAKSRCAALLAESGAGFAQREMYARVCNAVDIARLASRCPKGFGPFRQRLANLS